MSDKITTALNLMKSRILNSFMFTRREISPNYETHTSRDGKKAEPMRKYKLSHDTLHQHWSERQYWFLAHLRGDYLQ